MLDILNWFKKDNKDNIEYKFVVNGQEFVADKAIVKRLASFLQGNETRYNTFSTLMVNAINNNSTKDNWTLYIWLLDNNFIGEDVYIEQFDKREWVKAFICLDNNFAKWFYKK